MFTRAEAIQLDHRPGHWLPIVRSLAAQGVIEAQYSLGNIYSDERWSGMNCSARALSWYRRAIVGGDPTALYNLAITYRNWWDMTGYRYWLARAVRFEPMHGIELREFRARFPHEVMRRWRRYARER